jgi:cbb3-type cytochrome oxidase subunit 1
MALLRYQLFLAYAAVFLATWVYAVQNKHKLDLPGGDLLVDFAPLWAIVAFGAYAAGCLAVGLSQFKSYPEAEMRLEMEVAEAKAELKKRRIIQ